MRKTDEIFRFLDAPPTWFAMLVWTYPFFPFPVFCLYMSGLFRDPVILICVSLFVFFASLIFLFCASHWFRTRIIFIVPFWFIFMYTCLGMTQGSLTAAVSKAFSAVTSQLQNLSEVEGRERQLQVGSSEVSQKEESLLRKTLATAEAQKPQSLEVARAANQLALCCFHQGKYEESETLFLKSLTLREKLAGPNDPEVAESLIGLGLLYASRHQFEKAIVAHKRALSIDEKELGPNHPLLATDLRNLANDYKGFGNLPESEKLLRRAVAIDGDVPKSKQAISP